MHGKNIEKKILILVSLNLFLLNITPINYFFHFPIVETNRHKYSMELDAKFYYLCRLEIANVDARDIGCYKAVARNASGEGHATINLTFEEGKY